MLALAARQARAIEETQARLDACKSARTGGWEKLKDLLRAEQPRGAPRATLNALLWTL